MEGESGGQEKIVVFFLFRKISRGLIFGVVFWDLHSNSRRNKASSTSIELLAMPSHLDNLLYPGLFNSV